MKRAAIVLAVLLSVTAAHAQSTWNDRGVSTLREYFDMLRSGNFESATLMWKESIQERSERFGVVYDGVPVKIDCASPIVRNIDELYQDVSMPVRSVVAIVEDTLYQLNFRRMHAVNPMEYKYYLEGDRPYYWLTTLRDFQSRNWPVLETEYLRIHVAPSRKKYLNEAALQSADNFVRAMSDTLGIPSELTKEIANRKIEYFFVESDSSMLELTGHLTRGMFDVATNDIISSIFPHFHELTHLLVNIRLQHLPLGTQPLLQEGLATRFGGRWGKGPAALMDLGIFLHKEQIVEFDSILTMGGFNTFAGADIAYPVAGVFSQYLIDRVGLPRYLETYRALSGNEETINGMSPSDVQAVLAEAVEQPDWPAVLKDFDRYLDESVDRRITAKPGLVGKGKKILSDDGFEVKRDKQWLSFAFAGSADAPPEGTLMWGKDEKLTTGSSWLFDEHFKNVLLFEGYRYAVRFDRNEAGLYDYATNQLLAKYIWGITPSDDYIAGDDNEIRISFKRDMIGDLEPESGDYFFLVAEPAGMNQ